MKKYLLSIFLITFFAGTSSAGFEPSSIGARSNGLGNASITLSDPFALFNNQAAMAFQESMSVGLYTERRFMLKELSYYAGGVTVPTKSGVFGLSANYFGFDAYNEKKIGLAYSRLFTEKLSGGIQLDYLGTSISEYGNASAFTVEAGLLVKITEQFITGAHVFNPVRVNSGYADEKIPTSFRLGASYQPGKKIWLAVEAKKDMDNAARVAAGIEYRVIESLFLRSGFETNPSLYSFGIGINVNQLTIDLSSTYHSILGITPQVAISYHFEKNSSK